MRFHFLLAAALLVVSSLARGEDPAPAAPAGGTAEVYHVMVSRALDPRPNQRDTNAFTQLHLFFGSKSKEQTQYLLRIAELNPIEDDAGTLLSTKERLDENQELHEETQITTGFEHRDEIVGRYLTLTLAAPARQATKIKSIKGKAILSKAKLTALGFPDVASLQNKRLEHPLLKDFEIKATVHVKDEQTEIWLRTPRWNTRIVQWGLARDGKMLPEGVKSETTGQLFKIYPDAVAKKGTLLALVVREALEPEVIEFEFKDVPLP